MAKYVHVMMDLPRKYAELLIFAQLVLSSLTGNTKFPGAPNLTGLDAAIKLLQGYMKGGTGKQKAGAAEQLREVLRALSSWVEGVASSQASMGTVDLTTIAADVEGTGFALIDRAPRPKYVFGAAYGEGQGSVVLTAPASRARDSHEWQMSTNGKDWTSLPSTKKAKTTVTGLPVGVTHQFRHRLLTKDGYTDWTDPVATITVR